MEYAVEHETPAILNNVKTRSDHRSNFETLQNEKRFSNGLDIVGKGREEERTKGKERG